jgi:hypothetical protein
VFFRHVLSPIGLYKMNRTNVHRQLLVLRTNLVGSSLLLVLALPLRHVLR